MAWRLDPGTDLVLNLHLQPSGKDESVQCEVGIYFAKQPPARFPILVQLEHDGALRIPPNDTSFTISDSLILPVDAELLAIYPHAHYLGKEVLAQAVLPDGTSRQLIHIRNWDINWQAVYEYENPVLLPKGTKISMKIRYDNSAANPRNPNHPPKLVLTGNRSEDEMGHVWLQLLPKTKPGDKDDPRFGIQEAVMRRRLEKYPGDFLAQYNLAALMQTRGRFPEAASAYRAALQADPNNATAHNSLGSVLMLEDDLNGAIPELRECLRLDPGYLNAHFNLARALLANAELDAAAVEYSTLLRAKPDDAAAHVGLGTIYFKKHSYPEALASFREAARLNSNDADIQANLGTLLAISGDLPAAQEAFERALAIDPTNAAALANLKRVKAQLAAKK
jgi:tetratricopeptide (TPR) repeat protein